MVRNIQCNTLRLSGVAHQIHSSNLLSNLEHRPLSLARGLATGDSSLCCWEEREGEKWMLLVRRPTVNNLLATCNHHPDGEQKGRAKGEKTMFVVAHYHITVNSLVLGSRQFTLFPFTVGKTTFVVAPSDYRYQPQSVARVY